ncbi:MAG: phage tail tape measure protein [Pseudorhodoplanes sp.]|nr:phage tail tape measure protein [Pseudorhodoplanes sp.]
MADETEFETRFDEAGQKADSLTLRLRDLDLAAAGFARTMTHAFAASVTGARSFDDTLKSLLLRLSDLALRSAFKPLEQSLSSAFANLFKGGNVAAAAGAIKPFAAGGVIGTPTYFPLSGGGLGLAGEAGPEAILPLARGSDGRLGVAASVSGAPVSVVVNIATPDSESFRRSEAYLTGQIARAVARGQRGL